MNTLSEMSFNPVLRRELIERWRGRRAFMVISAYVALLGLVTMLLYWIGAEFLEDRMRWGGFEALSAGPTIGRFLFENILAFVMLLVLFIAPGYAAAQISGERERRTLALLQITLVRPAQIVAGKLGASVAWLLLLVVAALPVGAVAFFLGGVSIGDLMRGLVTLMVIAVSVAAVSLGISSLTRKTTASVVLTYAVVMMFILGTLFAALVETAVKEFRFNGGSRPVALYANPFYGLADAVRANDSIGNDLPSVLTPFGYGLPEPAVRDVFTEEIQARPAIGAPGGLEVINGVRGIGADRRPQRQPVWLITSGLYLLMGAVGFLVASRRVQADRGPLRKGKRKGEDQQLGTPLGAAGGPVPVGAVAPPPPGSQPPPPSGGPAFVNDPPPPPTGRE